MAEFREQVAAFKAQVEALSVRERLLILVALLAVLYLAWNALLQRRIEAENRRLGAELEQTNLRLDGLKRAVDEMLSGTRFDPNQSIRERQSRLTAEWEELQSRRAGLASSFLSPELTAELLGNVLRERSALRLISLQSSPPEPLISEDRSSAESSDLDQSRPMIYRHDIVLEFEGSFFDMLDYLKDLEGQPLFWDSIDYRVVTYPLARIRLRVFTLSFEKEWLGV